MQPQKMSVSFSSPDKVCAVVACVSFVSRTSHTRLSYIYVLSFFLSAATGIQKRQQRRHKEELDSLSSWIDSLEEQVRNEKEKFMLASRGSGSEVVSQLTASTAVAAEAAANAAKVSHFT